jgi:SPW repeat-containing protein
MPPRCLAAHLIDSVLSLLILFVRRHRSRRVDMAAPSIANAILGAWLSFAPWILSYRSHFASSNTVLFGLIVIALALFSAGAPRYHAFAGLNALVGLWVFASPFVLGFSHEPVAMWNSMIAGAFIVVFGVARAVVTVPATYGEDNPPLG